MGFIVLTILQQFLILDGDRALTTLQNNWAEFVSEYANGGLQPLAVFQSGNCCIALASGKKLTIPGSPYGYVFPASSNGGIRCNPTGGYKNLIIIFIIFLGLP